MAAIMMDGLILAWDKGYRKIIYIVELDAAIVYPNALPIIELYRLSRNPRAKHDDVSKKQKSIQ